MYRIPHFPVDAFRLVQPSEDFLDQAWATSFEIGDLIYSLRIESGNVNNLGGAVFFDNAGISPPRDDIVHFIKFDNDANLIIPEDAFKPLPKERYRTFTQAFTLLCCLVGGIETFCRIHNPDVMIGLPNTEKLATHYTRLCKRSALTERLIKMSMTLYHPYPALIVYRE